MKIKLNYNANDRTHHPNDTIIINFVENILDEENKKDVDFVENILYIEDCEGLKLFESLNKFGMEHLKRADLRSFEVIE
jgi:succinate dehydrogenase flavin-adding protein (antitoxin of CptAB toxin-antitoxin module)